MSSGNVARNFTPGGADDPRNPFHYMPSMGATVVSLILYALLFIVLTFWTVWKRSWYMIVLLVGCLMEVIGYATRIPLVTQPVGQTALYAAMHALIVLAPVFYAAIEYLLFGRLVHAVGDQYSLLKPKLVAWIFIVSDVFSFLIQSSGAGLLVTATTDAAKAKTGENVLLAGLAVNLASFALFCIQIFYFDYRTRKIPPIFPNGSVYQKRWRRFLYVIYISSFLVLIRQIYRVIEFAQGFTGYLAVNEAFFYVFDTLPIFISSAIYAIFFPGNGYLPPNRNDTYATMENNTHILTETSIINKMNNVISPTRTPVLQEKL